MQHSLEIDKISKNTFVMQIVLPVDGCEDKDYKPEVPSHNPRS